ncbi:SNARE associated Golgi protein, putative [Plasmodium berghei]|uniref:SNARE associated Golgi protein, putative n=2 Tax=Plasmodium berghei TaxID=5821 RepID=A0A509APM5_PLABA|nr:SNARE associated Golgi protein, putative [Plasmodium berghei ANKA]CXI69087.1 SNARE associated Golgi protein, putative [Plasmodium berghei]SCM24222.1 SNARE associated Golgi protein, putative [Plasmodium berghei]SCN27004.1 SNARE associated Golgi protein, putative [Plasmodium berghei]SCO61449.1 SNARE associated Golgi protein, putative [Plasmodium berghei]SCO63427.1 SNARE associated Golgi protein, putative [Plasmodium berghei]|eukprot:XP_034422621.1 SNARE associated Golgi protein, putative [Plasmodium berghei ANKA]
MENLDNHYNKKYEYLKNNYDTIYDDEYKNEYNEQNYNNEMNNYSNMNSQYYDQNNEKVKLINNNTNGNINGYKNNDDPYGNSIYNNPDHECIETGYHFDDKYANERNIGNNIMMSSDDLTISRRDRKSKIQAALKAVFIIVIFLFIVYLLTKFQSFINIINDVIQWVGKQGSWSILLFICLFTLISPLFMSVEIMCVGAGLIFSGVYGNLLGTFVAIFAVFTGYILGMSICFFISRYLLHDYIYKKLRNYPIYLAFDQAINANGLSFVLLIRMSPILPASVVSYVLGVTSVKYKEFAIGSVSALPGICLFIYIGVLLQDISNVSELHHHWGNLVILLVGLILGIIAIAYISIVTKRRLNNLSIMNPSLPRLDVDIE